MYQYNPDITIPDHEIVLTSARSGGPGGQHVNKTSTKVNLHWNLSTSNALTDEQKATILSKIPSRMIKEQETPDGIEYVIYLYSVSTRSQHKNREDVKNRLHLIVNSALVPIKIRKKTRTPKKAKERRLHQKKQQSQKKQERRQGRSRGGYDYNPRGNYMYQRNPSEYTDDELLFTALRNLANATEYSRGSLYRDVIDTIHGTAPPEIAFCTKRTALDNLLTMAEERSPDIIPQILRIKQGLSLRRNPWCDSEGWGWRRNTNGKDPFQLPLHRSQDQILRELEREYRVTLDPHILDRINRIRKRMGLPPFEEFGNENRRNPSWMENPDRTVYPYRTKVRLTCDSCGRIIHIGENCEATCMETESGSLLAPHEIICEDCMQETS